MIEKWVMRESVHRQMIEAGERDFPEETCGFVFGGDALDVVAMENIQNKLHAEDPVAHERDAKTAYQFDAADMERVLKERETASSPFRAIYHSHPNHDAYFSETDSAAAAVWGEPNFPGVVFLVYSIKEGQFADLKAFDWSDEAAAFVEIPVEIQPD